MANRGGPAGKGSERCRVTQPPLRLVLEEVGKSGLFGRWPARPLVLNGSQWQSGSRQRTMVAPPCPCQGRCGWPRCCFYRGGKVPTMSPAKRARLAECAAGQAHPGCGACDACRDAWCKFCKGKSRVGVVKTKDAEVAVAAERAVRLGAQPAQPRPAQPKAKAKAKPAPGPGWVHLAASGVLALDSDSGAEADSGPGLAEAHGPLHSDSEANTECFDALMFTASFQLRLTHANTQK